MVPRKHALEVRCMPTFEQVCGIFRSKQEAQAAYDRMSRWYDLLEGIWEKKSRDAGLRKLRVGEGECVLEIGFGTEHTLLALARSVGKSGKCMESISHAGCSTSPGQGRRKKGVQREHR